MIESHNLCQHPYRVMLQTTVRLQAGGERKSIHEHIGVSTLEEALKSVTYFQKLIISGEDTSMWGVIHDCWIEYIYRHKL